MAAKGAIDRLFGCCPATTVSGVGFDWRNGVGEIE